MGLCGTCLFMRNLPPNYPKEIAAGWATCSLADGEDERPGTFGTLAFAGGNGGDSWIAGEFWLNVHKSFGCVMHQEKEKE